jgi:hypothetical protein
MDKFTKTGNKKKVQFGRIVFWQFKIDNIRLCYEKSPKDPMDKFTMTGNKKKVGFGRIECFSSVFFGSFR